MAESDFNPTSEVVPSKRYTGHIQQASFSPTDGNIAAVAYIETTPANAAEINAKLAEIQALAETFGKKVWNPVTSEPGCIAWVHIRALAVTDSNRA